MAIGAITQNADGAGGCIVELLASATAVNGVPSGASAGLAVSVLRGITAGDTTSTAGTPDTLRIAVRSTAGSATMTVTLAVWAYVGGVWFFARALNASSAAPSVPVAIAELAADTLNYSEVVTGLSCASRIYCEVVAIGGTATAVTAYAVLSATVRAA